MIWHGSVFLYLVKKLFLSIENKIIQRSDIRNVFFFKKRITCNQMPNSKKITRQSKINIKKIILKQNPQVMGKSSTIHLFDFKLCTEKICTLTFLETSCL